MRDDRLYLIHIGECIERIVRYTAGGRAAFLSDTMVQDAVVRNLQVLAESTRRLSDAFKERRPEVDWRAIGAFRNVVVHDYLGLDIPQIWTIIERDVPPLKRAIEAALQELDGR